MEAIILASGSPRRSQILTQRGVAFEKHATLVVLAMRTGYELAKAEGKQTARTVEDAEGKDGQS